MRKRPFPDVAGSNPVPVVQVMAPRLGWQGGFSPSFFWKIGQGPSESQGVVPVVRENANGCRKNLAESNGQWPAKARQLGLEDVFWPSYTRVWRFTNNIPWYSIIAEGSPKPWILHQAHFILHDPVFTV